jgi:hypothetical protein
MPQRRSSCRPVSPSVGDLAHTPYGSLVLRPSQRAWVGTNVTSLAPSSAGNIAPMSPQTKSRTRSVHEAIGPACQITVSKDGRMVAFATVTTTDHDELFANVHIEPGHVPIQTRAALVDALMSVAGSDHNRHLNLVMPMGDCLLEDLYRRCDVRGLRPAGATCLVSAEVAGSARAGRGVRRHASAADPHQVDVAVQPLV